MDEEERAIEEQLLDADEPTLPYALTVQRDIAMEYFASKGRLYSDDPENNLQQAEAIAFEGYLWEKEMLEEIYEIPASIIIPNSFYWVPRSEEPHFYLHLKRCFLHAIRNSYEKRKKEFSEANFDLLKEEPCRLVFPLRNYKFWEHIPYSLHHFYRLHLKE